MTSADEPAEGNRSRPWLGGVQTDPAEVQAIYDGWAQEYDRDLASWRYDVPQVAARTLARHQPDAAPVLDVGCGTGMVGRALAAAGFDHVVGFDLSARSLELADATGAYTDLRQIDAQVLPFDVTGGAFAAVVCVGVLTYLPDTEETLAEFCRLVSPGGHVVVTQRDDLWRQRRCDDVLAGLAAAGTAEIVEVSEPLDYLPGNADRTLAKAHVAVLQTPTA